MNQTAIFQALAQELRLRALYLIAHEEELCVCELVHALEAEQPKISRHLTAMKNANILKAHRKAQWVYYSINQKQPEWQGKIIKATIEGAKDEPQLIEDLKRLQTMKNRPVNC